VTPCIYIYMYVYVYIYTHVCVTSGCIHAMIVVEKQQILQILSACLWP